MISSIFSVFELSSFDISANFKASSSETAILPEV